MSNLDKSDIEEVKADWEETEVDDVMSDPRPLIGPTFAELEMAYELNDKITYIENCEELGKFIRLNPDLPNPSSFDGKVANVWIYGEEEFFEVVNKLGNFEKDYADEYFKANKKVTNNLTYRITTMRSTVCEAVVVGQEEVEEYDYTNIPKKKVMKDIIEYKCQPIIGSNKDLERV